MMIIIIIIISCTHLLFFDGRDSVVDIATD